MEETNITNDTSQPIETPPINPTIPKPNNTYKYLFFITLISFLGFIIYSYTNSNTKNPQPLNNNVKKVVETTPTEIVENKNSEDEKKEITKEDTKNTYKAVSVQDDKNQISKLILIDQDNNEIVIDKEKYWQMVEQTLKSDYDGVIYSSDNNYIHYCVGRLECNSYLYDIKNKKIIRLNFVSEIKGFSSNSKYFYACSRSGPASGGVAIKELSSLENIFIIEGDYKCQYNKNIGEIIISEVSPSFDDDGKILSQYKFSEKTGVLTKIK